jgi:RecB family exonuclease
MQKEEPQIENNILKLSVSKSKTFDDCKKKFHFTYILKLPRKEADYHIFGKLCHRVLELFHLSYLNNETKQAHLVMSDAFRTSCAEFEEKMTLDMKKDCKEIVGTYLLQYAEMEEQGKLPIVYGVEKPFSFQIMDDVILNGVIDKVQLDPDGVLHIQDYKTTKNKKYLQNDWFQLLTYAFVLLNDFPDIEKVRVSYVLLRHQMEMIKKEFNISDIIKVKQKYLDYAERIIAEETYDASPSFMCNYCEFLEHCDEGKMVTGKNDRVKHGKVAW